VASTTLKFRTENFWHTGMSLDMLDSSLNVWFHFSLDAYSDILILHTSARFWKYPLVR
jgi:hypothetical protein